MAIAALHASVCPSMMAIRVAPNALRTHCRVGILAMLRYLGYAHAGRSRCAYQLGSMTLSVSLLINRSYRFLRVYGLESLALSMEAYLWNVQSIRSFLTGVASKLDTSHRVA